MSDRAYKSVTVHGTQENSAVMIMNKFSFLKWYCDQENNSYFSLDFKTMLTKH